MWAFRKKYLTEKEHKPLTILDLGSMDVNGSYRECFDGSAWRYIGVDLAPGKNVDVVLRDPYCWREMKSQSVDVLVSGQAFEHVEYFWITALEIARMLKPGGLCCLIAPSSGREHKYPVDCWRFYPDGFAALARFAALEVVELSTQWEDQAGYTDCSNTWHDTVLVAKNPIVSGTRGVQRNVRRALLQRVMAALA